MISSSVCDRETDGYPLALRISIPRLLAVAGLGTFFGVRTLQKADDYNDGRLADRDEA